MRLPIVASPFAPPAAVSAYASHVFAELPTRILSVQPSVYTDASARRDWGWHPQFDLPATADHLLARVTTTRA